MKSFCFGQVEQLFFEFFGRGMEDNHIFFDNLLRLVVEKFLQYF